MATIASLLRTDYKAVDKRDEVRSVYGWLRGDSDKVPLVVDDGKPVGIVNERALMSRRLDSRAKLESYTLSTRALQWTATLEQAAERMREFRAAYLPVEDARGQLAGFVTAIDVARAANLGGRASEMCLPVQVLAEKHTLGEALHAFAQEYVDFLPVTDGAGKLRGVLPRRSVLEMELNIGDAKGRRDSGGERIHVLKDVVSGFMDEAPVTLPAAASFATLLDTLEESGYAFVSNGNGGLLGVVTPETLWRAAPM
jgi:CBS domain-containing protein